MGYEIDFLPVGDGSRSGDAIAVRYGDLEGSPADQTVIVIDGGFTDDGEALVELLWNAYGTRRADIVVATHPEQDHIRGLEVVLERLEVGQLWMHRPWVHSGSFAASRSTRFATLQLSESLQESMTEASQLEVIAAERNILVLEPFMGLSSADGCF